MSKKKKELPTESSARVPDVLKNAVLAHLQDEEGQLTLPVLFECLTPQFEGAKLTRPGGKLSISVEGVYWRVQLDLPYERLTCRMYSASLASVLSDLNAYLGSGKAIFSPMYERNKKPLPRLDKPIE
jgi:hypothetical protein